MIDVGPIVSPEQYRLWWLLWTVAVVIVGTVILAAMFWWLGPHVIARGIELYATKESR